jgi:para-nitrobenzyl esterase
MKPMRRNLLTAGAGLALASTVAAADGVKTRSGTLLGTSLEGGIRVRVFKGIPFAAPPVGELRWKPPQEVPRWKDARRADTFGPRCMQRAVFSDMVFRSNGMSEDCLYLNVWTPARSGRERLPVLVYFYGGGFFAGDGSEPRYDGESMARKGIVALTVNYRLGVFGFFSHPELSRESAYRASGNQGLLDQSKALAWVRENIAAFGGDPGRVTIAGESAGSISVSAQMASPLSKHLIAGAIGESGAMIATLPAVPLAEGEQNGSKFAAEAGATSLAALRAMSAEALLEAAAKPGLPRFAPTIDGHFLPKPPLEVFEAGEQARVPLLAGWNSEESAARGVLRASEPTPENYAQAVKALYPDRAEEVLRLYPGTTNDEVIQSATDLASDRFIGYGTWKWLDVHGRTGGKPVYRYFYSRPRPPMNPQSAPADAPPPARGAAHAAEIEYAMGNLRTNPVYAWTADDHKLSATMQDYFANFVKAGDPNGPGLPAWPASNRGDVVQLMRLDVDTRAETERHRDRYLLLDRIYLRR